MRQPIPFGKYYLLERINVGGMAEVFKAKATGVEGFERLVAVKRILPSIAEDEEFILMFVDEAKIAVQLTHANIAQIFDLGRVEGSFFIALEYVHGKDLRAIFNRARQRAEPLPIPLSCYAIMKLCEGLDYAHNKHDGMGNFLNLVHRDVSPQNILISYEGEVKIIDFGIAKAAGKAGRTQAGILKGKFGYMSPEQVLGLEIDRRSDIFGVGICLYELLTGERLFVAESDFATLEKVRSVDIMPPSTYNRRIPEELEQIVMRALARDRDRRHQTAMQLHDDLQAFMHTSASFFSRKDLAQYMHRVFAEEIEKETARDKEYAAMDPLAGDNEDSGLAAFDQIDPVSTVSALSAQPSYGMVGAAPAGAPAHSRKSTLLGMQPLNVRGEPNRAPSVPRLVPAPHSIPAPVPRAPRSGLGEDGMDWDEDELSTQIYDKPDELPEFGSNPDFGQYGGNGAHPDWLPREPTPPGQPAPFPAPGSYASDPEVMQGAPEGESLFSLEQNPEVGFAPQRPAALTAGRVPRATGPFAPAAAASVDDEPLVWQAKSKGRPMVVAVVSVFAIVTSIVLGLLLFGQRDPGTLHLVTVPSRVSVGVDGRALGVSTSPFVIGELSAGKKHTVTVHSPGFHPWSGSVELQPGQVLALPQVKLEAIETGFTLDSVPSGASVFIDGKASAEHTPLRARDLRPGEHQIRLELAGYAAWESAFKATSGTVLPLQTVALQPLAAEQPAPSRYGSHGWRSRSGSSSSTGGLATADRHALKPSAASSADQEDLPDETEDKPVHTAKSAPPPTPDEEPAAAEPEPKPAAAESSKPAAESGEKGTLRVNTRPWSQVFIDGKSFGNTPRMNVQLSAGDHTLTFVNDEFGIRKTIPVTITAGKIETLIVNLVE